MDVANSHTHACCLASLRVTAGSSAHRIDSIFGSARLESPPMSADNSVSRWLEGVREGNDADVQRATGAVGATIAAKIWQGVVEANHSIELGSGSLADHINSIARSDIGDDVLRRALPGIRHLFKTRLPSEDARFADQDFKEDDE